MPNAVARITTALKPGVPSSDRIARRSSPPDMSLVLHVLQIELLEIGVLISPVLMVSTRRPCFMIPMRVPDSLARKIVVAISTATPCDASRQVAPRTHRGFGDRVRRVLSRSSAPASFAIAIAMPTFWRIPFE